MSVPTAETIRAALYSVIQVTGMCLCLQIDPQRRAACVDRGDNGMAAGSRDGSMNI